MTDDEQKRLFARNLAFYLARSGKTQLEVAKSIGVSPQTFNAWMRGIAIPRMNKIEMLTKYFNISKTELLDEHNPEHMQQVQNEKKLFNEEFNVLCREILKIPDEDYRNDVIGKMCSYFRDSIDLYWYRDGKKSQENTTEGSENEPKNDKNA